MKYTLIVGKIRLPLPSPIGPVIWEHRRSLPRARFTLRKEG